MAEDYLEQLRQGSAALQGVLGALIEAERHFAPPATPLERLQQITTSPEWAWLQPLTRLIADLDHALAYASDLPASEAAAIGAHARELLGGTGTPGEPAFFEHYRALLQGDPGGGHGARRRGCARCRDCRRRATTPPSGCTRGTSGTSGGASCALAPRGRGKS